MLSSGMTFFGGSCLSTCRGTLWMPHTMHTLCCILAGLLTPVCMIHTDNYRALTSCPGQIMKRQFIAFIIRDVTKVDCGRTCSEDDSCESLHYDSSSRMCHLNTDFDNGNCSKMEFHLEIFYYFKVKVCMNGGILQSNSRCRCVNGYVGSKCQRLMRDCKEGFAAGFGYGHGQYFIQPASASTPFKVFCRMWFGGRTIIQWRKDSFQEPFNRSWAEYRDGFGRLGGDHWLGLKKMYHICKPGTVMLTIEIRFENTPNDYKQQSFYHFSLSNEKNDYRMYFSHSEGIAGHAMGDSLTPLKNCAFSTYDRDNDNSDQNCAVRFGSGFWFNACADCNPNGYLDRQQKRRRTSDSDYFWTYDLGDRVPYISVMWLG